MVTDTKSTVKPKRHKKRKSRTQVSSSSDNDSESDRESLSGVSPPRKDVSAAHDENELPQASNRTQQRQKNPSTSTSTSSSSTTTASASSVDAAFTSFYLQRATLEFAEDLDAVRKADDFREEQQLGLLIGALRQGTALFGEEERRRIVGGGGSSGG